MLPGILLALVPSLVKVAESLFEGDGRGKEKHAWVVEAMHDAEPLILKFLPEWKGAKVEELEKLVGVAIVFALDKLEG